MKIEKGKIKIARGLFPYLYKSNYKVDGYMEYLSFKKEGLICEGCRLNYNPRKKSFLFKNMRRLCPPMPEYDDLMFYRADLILKFTGKKFILIEKNIGECEMNW